MSDRAVRYPANFPVVLRQGADLHSATICNISLTGGCILGAKFLTKGEVVLLDYESGQTRAEVMWTTGNMTGLRFESPISDEGVQIIRSAKSSRERA